MALPGWQKKKEEEDPRLPEGAQLKKRSQEVGWQIWDKVWPMLCQLVRKLCALGVPKVLSKILEETFIFISFYLYVYSVFKS